MTEVVRFGALVPQRWANGRGSTVELVRLPGSTEWSVRVSVATIDGAAPFSRLPGIDRVLIPLESLSLVVDGALHRLGRHDVLAFAGEADVAAADVTAPLQVLNVMTRRGAVSSVELLPAGPERPVPAHGVVVALEPAAVDGTRLDALDAAAVAGAVPVGGGLVAVIRLETA